MADGGASRLAWRALLDVLRDIDVSFLEDPRAVGFGELERAEGYRHLTQLLSYGFDLYVESDPDRPEFLPLALPTKKILGDNVDARYTYTALRGDRSYRITGQRADDCYLSFQVHAGGDPGVHLSQRTVGHLNHTGIVTDKDGRFEIVVSKQPHDGNWVALSDDAVCMITREYYFDPISATRASFRIEPLDDPGAPAPLSDAGMAARLRAVAGFLLTTAKTVPMAMAPLNEYAPPFRFTVDMPSWGTPDNVYCRAFYDLAEDEALVIEGEIIPCVYFGIQLWNPYMQSLDWRYHRCSFNNVQLGLRAGDRFEVAVAHQQPGDLPWLQTAGHRQGAVFARWLVPEGSPSTPTARVVKLNAL